MQLTALPKAEDLETSAKTLHMSFEKCEATWEAYSGGLTSEMILSISDARIHELNIMAFACMQLGGKGVLYGYELKTLIDSAYAMHGITDSLQKQEADTVRVAGGMLEKVVAHNNTLVEKYNDLVERYNSLLNNAKATVAYAVQLERINNQINAIAAQAFSAAGYSSPTVVVPSEPSNIYVQQSPLHCTSQRIGSFTYTDCF